LDDELIAYLFVPRDGAGVKKRWHRHLDEAVASLTCPGLVLLLINASRAYRGSPWSLANASFE
jgi:hypothetical protein